MGLFSSPLKKKAQQAEIVAEAEQHAQKKKVGQIRLKKGQKLYKINQVTMKIEQVVFKTIKLNPDQSLTKDLTLEPGILYIPAINEKNALRKAQTFIANGANS